MNEQSQAQVFNDALDAIIAGDETRLEPGELSETVKLAGYLHQLDLAADTTDLQRDIRMRLTTRKKEKYLMRQRQRVIGAVLILILIGVCVLSPAGAFAQSILRRIGGISLSTAPPRLEEESLTIEAEPDDEIVIPTIVPTAILNDSEIENLAGYPGWLPTFVPEGYSLDNHYVEYDNAGNPLIRTVYTQEVDDTFSFFSLQQNVTIADPQGMIGQWNIGDAPVRDVSVSGNAAVFVEQAQITADGANILIWTADEYTFILIAMDLDQAAMLTIAESIQAP